VVLPFKTPQGDRSMGGSGLSRQPSPEEIRLALGPRHLLWGRLTLFIETNCQAVGKWGSWGPVDFGWGLRYRRKGKALAERALNLKLGEKVSKLLQEAPQLRDGRWLSIPVLDEADGEDVERLLLIKM